MKSRTRLWLSIGIPVLLIVVIVGVYLAQQRSSNSDNTAAQSSQTTIVKNLTTVRLALDWTPNTNHTGIYVAQHEGWYQQAGIKLVILPYSQNVSPDTMVSTGKADVGISSTESIVADAAVGQPVVSIAAILQHNTSSLAVLANSGINTPRDLDGKTYGAFGAPYETPVLRHIIQHAGGKGNFKSVTLNIDTLQALQSHRIDFAWIFDGAEGIQAQHEGIKLKTFPIIDYGIADYYTPNLISSPQEIKSNSDVLHRFMAATVRGYEYARTHSDQSAQMLIQQAPKGSFPDPAYVLDSQKYLSTRYADSGRKWGLQDALAWHGYPQFILATGSVQDAQGKPITSLNLDALYTNQFLS
ncbi:ABC transporter substrate-binding protein [Dictyobacter arantiisoli]|uniref:Thiamine pyrimidine synthase n=1 Tax=Dictyobacter arantiisoli TaxID=2014874 RepID=A0A5A5T986_9CHLR|nr:ABC transporter substrate-binding protein [Dictyobacter arantiisoli]GCF07736.1 nitrate ABC transporter substrate-binding protein [Dictyobacter arantiisoli]